MKKLNYVIMFLHVFVGIGALFGGLLAIMNPGGVDFGMPADEFLVNSPFKDFLIPGIFLFVALGLGNLIGFILLKGDIKYNSQFSIALGLILGMWIVIQCYVLSGVAALHIIFFVIGIIQMALPIQKYKRVKRA